MTSSSTRGGEGKEGQDMLRVMKKAEKLYFFSKEPSKKPVAGRGGWGGLGGGGGGVKVIGRRSDH